MNIRVLKHDIILRSRARRIGNDAELERFVNTNTCTLLFFIIQKGQNTGDEP